MGRMNKFYTKLRLFNRCSDVLLVNYKIDCIEESTGDVNNEARWSSEMNGTSTVAIMSRVEKHAVRHCFYPVRGTRKETADISIGFQLSDASGA